MESNDERPSGQAAESSRRSGFDDHGFRWAQASGWMQLSGKRRTVSCVVPTFNQLNKLSKLLPELSDALTETGYPWEIIVVDAGSNDGTDRALDRWRRLPGCRFAASPTGSSRAQCIVDGLLASRGDAVVILDPGFGSISRMLSHAVARWDEGAMVLSADAQHEEGLTLLSEWHVEADIEPGQVLDTSDFSTVTAGLVLMDRSFITEALNGDPAG